MLCPQLTFGPVKWNHNPDDRNVETDPSEDDNDGPKGIIPRKIIWRIPCPDRCYGWTLLPMKPSPFHEL